MMIAAALIVKNELPVIRRCLNSICRVVDIIHVNDNGSTDGTQAVLYEYSAHVDTLPWVGFSANRNYVLALARSGSDYVLCGIDADEELVVPESWTWPELTADAYYIWCHYGDLRYKRMALVKSSVPWRWKGVLHEALVCDGLHITGTLPDIYIQVHSDGARATDPNTQERDLATLQAGLAKEPENARYQFYVAQTLKDLGRSQEALEAYDARIAMTGWWEERWYSMYMKALMADRLGMSPLSLYFEAWGHNPKRAEPLYNAADWCRRRDLHAAATMMANAASRITMPDDGLFLENDVYQWRALDVLAATAWYTPYRAQGRDAARVLIQEQLFPETERARIEANAAFYEKE